MIDPLSSPLLTELYQFTMLQVYHAERMDETAVFELFFRRFPPERGFLLAAGLESVVDWLEQLAFTREELDYLASTRRFSPGFLASLAGLRFTGDVDAMPEGTVFFADEPVLRVTARLAEAQLVESRILNLIHLQTLIASKAARCVLASAGRAALVDFGLRRAHGAEAGFLAARAAFLAGFAGTATVLAGERFGIPLFGTMAHSYIEAGDDEEEAFVRFGRQHPANTTLLIDTYDTLRGAARAARAAKRLAAEGIKVKAVRLDSGDHLALSREVRTILDREGEREIRILASGNLDEHGVARLLAAGAPINAFGIGTRLVIPPDPPDPDCAYKLMEYAGQPRLKLSESKSTRPGRKQVWRREEGGVMREDLIGLIGEQAEGEPLLLPVMRNGRRLAAAPPLPAIAALAKRQLAALPEELRRIDGEITKPYPVKYSAALETLAAETERGLEKRGHSTFS